MHKKYVSLLILCTHIHAYIHTYVHTYIHAYIHAYIYTYVHTYIFLSDAAERYPLGEAIVTGSHPGYLEPCALHTSTETCDARAGATTSRGGSSSCTCHGWPVVQLQACA